MATARDSVRRLWDVCQLPDFRKLSADEHVRMVRTLFLFLMRDGVFPMIGWRARSRALDMAEGDVATLSGRLAQIRTFTYAAHRPGWTRDGAHWQGETRAVEDRLSDALHERLTQRFIDRRTSILMKHLREDEFADRGVGGRRRRLDRRRSIGRLDGFRFTPDPRAARYTGANPCARPRCEGWKANFSPPAARAGRGPRQRHHASASMASYGGTAPLSAQLAAGSSPLAPQVDDAGRRIAVRAHRAHAVQARLEAWMTARMEARLEPLLAWRDAAEAAPEARALPGQARGIAHQLAENFGALDRATLALPEKLGPCCAH